MPNRTIKESICTSESLAQLTDFEENLFYKLIVNCDDYGRFDGRPTIIKSRCYPLRDRLTLKSIEEAISSLARVGCVELYEVDSKPYLHFPAWRFHQQIRAKYSKYPAPGSTRNHMISDDINGNQSPANAPEYEYDNEYDNGIDIPPLPPQGEPGEADRMLIQMTSGFQPGLKAAVAEWLQYKKEKGAKHRYKPTGLKTLLNRIGENAAKYGDNAMIEAVNYSISNNYDGIVWDKVETGGAGAQPKAAQKTNKFLEYAKEVHELG